MAAIDTIGSLCLGKAPMKNEDGEIFYCACCKCTKEEE